MEKSKKIPSQVYFNHFYAINYKIQSDFERYKLKKIPFYNNIKLRNPNFSIKQLQNLLWNSWSTEYAHLVTSSINIKEYYKFSMHWNFPQVYYSIYLSMTAFHQTQGIANDKHESSIKVFGSSIKDNHYPAAISFYSTGGYKKFKIKGLDLNNFNNQSSLSKINSLEDAHNQIAIFLNSTRKKNAENKKLKISKKDKKFLLKNGEIPKRFNEKLWNYIYESIPVTSILNILYRLRIKANYHDIETFINAEIDFKEFHFILTEITNYLNFIHEAYICKAIGQESYKKILYSFPAHLNTPTAIYRYENFISKI